MNKSVNGDVDGHIVDVTSQLSSMTINDNITTSLSLILNPQANLLLDFFYQIE